MISPFASFTKRAHSTLLTLLFFVCFASSLASMNRTIDDTYGDPATGVYPTFVGTWFTDICDDYANLIHIAGKLDELQACIDSCHEWGPSNASAFDNTYKVSASTSETLTLQFTGTAIYVYTIVLDSTQSNFTQAGFDGDFGAKSFSTLLDGQLESGVQGDSTRQPALPAYNVLLYSKTGLENASHNLTLNPSQGGPLIFDYAVYTFEEAGPAASAKKNLAGPIAGGLGGGLVLLGSIAILLYRAYRRRRTSEGIYAERTHESDARISPFPSGEIHVSLSRAVSSQLLSDEKNILRRAHREEAARQVEILQKEIQGLGAEVEGRGLLAEASDAEHTNAQLVTEIKILRERMAAMKQQIQMLEPPEYSADGSVSV
ncbi:hypothetical protein MVEN_00237100 [Mycena venus]|uniref:Uncharacterized protein n=1 Tax=Mycena venus TaxID=2733690 RepID=A0A8H7DB84_9AGAR|nr:hypothetical protein MVEN_00237100 [Mycena venus]